MRFASAAVGGIRVFAVAGTNTVSFGIERTRRPERVCSASRSSASTRPRASATSCTASRCSARWCRYPTRRPTSRRSSIRSRVWSGTTSRRRPGGLPYDSIRSPARRRTSTVPGRWSRSTSTTEPLYGAAARTTCSSIAASRPARRTPAGSADSDPTTADRAKRRKALAWLSRDLDDAMMRFIRSARPGDAIRGAFYEFGYRPVLAELKAAIDSGVDVQLVIDLKVNEHTRTRSSPTARRRWSSTRAARGSRTCARSRMPGSRHPRSSRGEARRRPSRTTSSWCC